VSLDHLLVGARAVAVVVDGVVPGGEVVPMQRIGQAANGGLIEWLGEVDAGDVGTDVAGDRADGQFDALGGDVKSLDEQTGNSERNGTRKASWGDTERYP
jgi:hypothetical protein